MQSPYNHYSAADLWNVHTFFQHNWFFFPKKIEGFRNDNLSCTKKCFKYFCQRSIISSVNSSSCWKSSFKWLDVDRYIQFLCLLNAGFLSTGSNWDLIVTETFIYSRPELSLCCIQIFFFSPNFFPCAALSFFSLQDIRQQADLEK